MLIFCLSYFIKLVFRFYPIPTGCCHVTLLYGLIPPMAGRNRVKQVLFKNYCNVKKIKYVYSLRYITRVFHWLIKG